jgi:quercetin dioxygenase-like cupin family protein
MKTIKSFKRIVTGINEQGKSTVMSNDIAKGVLDFGDDRPFHTHTYLWKTKNEKQDFNGFNDPIDSNFKTFPSPGGTTFLVVQFDPQDDEVLEKINPADGFEKMGALENLRTSKRHPYMHATPTVDYGYVISGKIKLLLDEGDEEVELSQGDVLVQRGARHAWYNPFNEPCIIAFTLVDGQQ